MFGITTVELESLSRLVKVSRLSIGRVSNAKFKDQILLINWYIDCPISVHQWNRNPHFDIKTMEVKVKIHGIIN